MRRFFYSLESGCYSGRGTRPGFEGQLRLDLAVVIGLGIFGFAFAVVSSLHSYLILA